MGDNTHGQLGMESRVAGSFVDTPRSVEGPLGDEEAGGLRIGAIACGACHALAITNDGAKVWAWGSNVHGQLGVGVDSSNAQRVKPSLIPALSNRRDVVMCQVTAASNHSLALTTTGEVFAFGLNSHGQLGFPTVKSANESFLAEHENGAPFVQQCHRAKARNKVEMDQPKLYENGIEKLWLPVRVVSLSQYRVRAVATGDMHTLTIAQHYHS
eukprot:g2387.t1